MMEGVNLTMIIIRNFVNVTIYPQYSNNKNELYKNVLKVLAEENVINMFWARV
jgi:hypothetical protein